MQETNSENKTGAKNQFTRKARIGINPITLDEGKTRYLEINSDKVDIFASKNYPDGIPFVLATDMETGEDGHFWLSGGLNYQLKEAAGKKALKGLKIEVLLKGQKAIEIVNEDGEKEKVKVNQYDLYELN